VVSPVREHLGARMSAEASDDLVAIQQAYDLLNRDVFEALAALNKGESQDDVALTLEYIAGDYTNLFAGLRLTDGEAYQPEPEPRAEHPPENGGFSTPVEPVRYPTDEDDQE
jgi:hypothetical protein